MGKSRRHRSTGPERRRKFTAGTSPSLPSRWQRCTLCGATIAADPSRMGKQWADVHEPGCPVPWDQLGLGGPPCEVWPGAPRIPAGSRLRAVNRRPGAVLVSPGYLAAMRRQS